MGRKSKSRKLEAAARSQYPQLFRHGGPEPVEAPVEARPPESGSEDGSMVRASASRWIQWHVPVLVALVTFTAFWPALQNQFVDWDDSKNFVDNPQYRGLAGTHLRWMWTTFHMGHYAPLTWMRSEEHTSELQSLCVISYAVFCLKKKKKISNKTPLRLKKKKTKKKQQK